MALALAAVLAGVPAYAGAADPTEITGATLNEISITNRGGSPEGEYLINPTGGTLDVSGAVFIDSRSASGSKVTLAADKTLIVGTSLDPDADKDFELQGSGGPTRFILEEGSKLQVVADEFGINVGTSYDGGGQTKSQLIVKGGNNSSAKAVTIEADSFFHIFGRGEFLVEDNSTVNINMTNPSGGYFLTGRYDGDLPVYNNEADPDSFSGGLFKMGVGSQANIDGNAYFGYGGAVDVGLNTLNIDGDAIFKDGSDYRAARTETAVGKISATGEVTIEEGAKVSFFKPNTEEPSAVIGINDNNKVILEAGSFHDGTLLRNALFDFRIENSGGGQRMVVSSYTGSAGAIQNAAGTMSANYAQTAGLVDRLLTSADTPVDLSNRLIGNLEGIDALADSGDRNAEKAVKQLVGEEALASVNAAIDTAQQVTNTLGGRFNTLHDAYQAPAGGYADSLNRIWLSGFGNWVRQENKSGIYGYDYDSGGIVLGYDREVESVPGLTLGASGAWSNGTVKNNDHLTETDVDVFSFGLYSSYEFGNGLFLDGNINYGFVDNDTTTKLILGGRKKGSFDSSTLQMGLTLGYSHNLTPSTRLIPSVGVQYIHAEQDGWRESISADPGGNAVAHWFGEVRNDFVEFPVKLRLNSTIEVGSDVLITPELRVGGTFVAHRPDARMQVGFVGSGASTVINGINPGKNRYQIGGGVKVQITDVVDVVADKYYEGPRGLKSHSATPGLGFTC